MPALIKKNHTVRRSESEQYADIPHAGMGGYFILVPSGAGTNWLSEIGLYRREPENLASYRPASMLQPVSFDDSTDHHLRVVRLQPVDEDGDDW